MAASWSKIYIRYFMILLLVYYNPVWHQSVDIGHILTSLHFFLYIIEHVMHIKNTHTHNYGK